MSRPADVAAANGYSQHAPRSRVRVTPVVAVPELGHIAGKVVFKLENLQRTGSFKLRGAVRAVAALPARAAQTSGVITASAGNHGAGLALAAAARGVRARVVVSELTPANKRARIASLGAEVIVAGAGYDEAEAVARELAEREGALFVSAYDDDEVIEGNGGDLVRELATQVDDLAQVICPVGGGGVIGGIGRAVADIAPDVRVVGAQPASNCAMHDSLAQGRALTEYRGGETLAEGCEGAVAQRTYELALRFVDSIALVGEDAIERAVAFCYHRAGQIVECSAAVAVAALLEGAVQPAATGTTVVLISGGNIEPTLLDRLIGA